VAAPKTTAQVNRQWIITTWLFSHLGIFERSEQIEGTEIKYNQASFTLN